MSPPMKLIIKNLEQLVTVTSSGQRFKAGPEQDVLAVIERRPDGVGCCLVVDHNGLITAIGHDDEVLANHATADKVLDGQGCSLVPGFVDAHTHPVWSGERLFEFELKMRGASYLAIHEAGGGIYHTVQATRASDLSHLTVGLVERLRLMMSCGSTLVECKTGYGLDFETELKQLLAIEAAKREQEVELVTTFLGAHAVPRGMTADEGVSSVVDAMSRLSREFPELKVDFVDVFCESGVFSMEQSRTILERGRSLLGCDIGFHGDELTCIGAGELAGQLGARSVSHLEFVSDKGLAAMAASGTAAVICPTTAHLLRLEPPPVRKMIDKASVIVALGSDFNPNAFCYSMPAAMNLAVITCRMTLNEALVASTLNAAYALNRSRTHGSLEVGKVGDAVLLKTPDWRRLIYQMAEAKDLIKAVIKRGSVFNGSN